MAGLCLAIVWIVFGAVIIVMRCIAVNRIMCALAQILVNL